MEFDTKLPLRKLQDFEISTLEPFEEIHKKIYDCIRQAGAKALGDGSDGQIWADFSTSLTTRHMVCDIVRDPDKEGTYYVKLRTGRRPSYLGDLILAVLGIGAFYGLSKSVVPSPPAAYVALMLTCFTLAGYFISVFGKAFGDKECQSVRSAVETAFTSNAQRTTLSATMDSTSSSSE